MNTKNPIRDAHGRSLFAIGGAQAWKTHEAGDYRVSMEWIDGEPGMVIWSAHASRDFAFAICLSSAGKYATPSGSLTEEGADELARALPALGREINRRELVALADVVLRYIPELIAMPPAPLEIRRSDLVRPLLEVEERDRATDKTLSHVSI